MLSLMFAPHSGRGLFGFAGYAHGPFFIMPSYIDGKQLVLQTVFIAVVNGLLTFADAEYLFAQRLVQIEVEPSCN